jgi:Polyribonucleotide nucleotidyltransferase (polynucleotide phosphorylase)
MVEKVSIEVGGKVIEFEVGRMAKQAGGAVFATCGGTQCLQLPLWEMNLQSQQTFSR